MMSGLLLVNSSGKNGMVLWMEQQASPLCGNVWLPLSIQKLLTPWSGETGFL